MIKNSTFNADETAEHILELVQSSGAKILVTVGPGINAQIWKRSVHVKQSLPDVVLVCISAPEAPEVECVSFDAALARHRGDALKFASPNLPDSVELISIRAAPRACPNSLRIQITTRSARRSGLWP